MRFRISSGALRRGDRLPTFAEICSEFGVTPTTASKAFQVLEREGLVSREKGKGIFVAAPVLQRQYAVGCYNFGWDQASSPYWAQLMRGIRSVADKRGADLILLPSHSTRGLEKVDGVLLHGDKGPYPNFPPGLARLSVGETNQGIGGVLADDFEGTRGATRHLMDLGHERIAFLGLAVTPIVQIRLAGYSYEYLNRGLPRDSSWIRELENLGDASMFDVGFKSMQSWWSDRSPGGWRQLGCTAILCQNDAVACGVIAALQELQCPVPQEVSVVGHDDTGEHLNGSLRLTTVRVPLERLGARAMELLLEQIEGNTTMDEIITLPTELMARTSTGPRVAARNSG